MSTPTDKPVARRRGPAPRPRHERLEEARQRRTWTTDPAWLSAFRESTKTGLAACPSYPGVAADRAGHIWLISRLPQQTLDAGYRTISLNYTQQSVHRLICAAWSGPPPRPDAIVLHRDGDAANNTPANLAWGTPAENQADRYRHKTERGPSPNKGRRRSSGQTGPQARQGDAAAFLAILGAQDARERVRAVPDGQGLFSTVGGEIWQVSRPTVEIDDRGYHRCSLTPHEDGQAETRKVRIHQLVADAHLGPAGDAVVRHLDGVPFNNRADNLRYGTMAENMADRDAHGRTRRGEQHSRAKLTEDDVLKIRVAYATGERVTVISRRHQITPGTVTAIATGKERKRSPGPISEPRGNPEGADSPRATISDDTAAAIWSDLETRARLTKEFDREAVSARLGVTTTQLARVLRNPVMIERMRLSEERKAALREEVARHQAARLENYRIERIADRHGTSPDIVLSIGNGAWSSVTGGRKLLTGGRHVAAKRRSRTVASPATVALVFKLLKEQQEIGRALRTLSSLEIAARLGFSKSQVDDISSGKAKIGSLRAAADAKAALLRDLDERKRLQALLPTRAVIAAATGLSACFIKAVSAGHAWREEAVEHGYTQEP